MQRVFDGERAPKAHSTVDTRPKFLADVCRPWNGLSEPFGNRTPFVFLKLSFQNNASLLGCLTEQCLMSMAMCTVVVVNVNLQRGRRKPRGDHSKGMFGWRHRASLGKEQAPEFREAYRCSCFELKGTRGADLAWTSRLPVPVLLPECAIFLGRIPIGLRRCCTTTIRT